MEEFEKGVEIAKSVESMLNSCSNYNAAAGFVHRITTGCHRYLQNEFFRLIIMGSIDAFANAGSDPRNASAVLTARYLKRKADSAWDEERENIMSFPVKREQYV